MELRIDRHQQKNEIPILDIFVERLWRTVKYEEVYLHDYLSVPEARERLAPYFDFYNTERPH